LNFIGKTNEPTGGGQIISNIFAPIRPASSNPGKPPQAALPRRLDKPRPRLLKVNAGKAEDLVLGTQVDGRMGSLPGRSAA
jgi:hypothetical protein